MSAELSRRNFLALLGSMTAAGGTLSPWSLLAAPEKGSSTPLSPAVVRGNARFQVLSPTLVRMEYAPSGLFIDVPSVSVLNRRWPACPYETHDVNGWVEIATSKMRVKYKLESGKFGAENLAVSWKDATGDRTWKPGDVDDKNLGGVQGKGDFIGKIGDDPGPLSRNGYFRLDDSATAVWNAAADWPEPRPNREEGRDWYFFTYGHDYKLLLRELSQLLGPIPMVPRYVFGTWFCSRGGYSSDERKRIAYRFREEEIPLDMMVLDSESSAAMIYRGFGWDPEQLPDPRAFFAWMKARGIKVAVNEHYLPITRESDPHFDQVREQLGLPEETKEIPLDLADKKFAQIYMDLLHKPMLDMGMAFYWQDGAAPSSMPGLDDTFWTRHVEYEGQERLTGKRTFIFARLRSTNEDPSPSTLIQWGVHRYGGYFTGDLFPFWSSLDMFVPFNVRAGNMLVPYVSHDTPVGIGNENLDHEVYQRGVQLAALSPLFRWHSAWGMRLPWEYGDECFSTAKRFLTLRYRLLPYIYTYSRLAHETGAPLVRGTYLEYPEQERAYTFTRQYLFGQEFLVAPVLQPGRGRPVRKEIYLPEGEDWFDYFTGRIHSGGQVLFYECPVTELPLFVKAGSIVPMALDMDYTDQGPLDPLILDVYAGKAAAFRLYEDDGASLDYRKQAYAWTPLSYAPGPAQGDYVIRIGPTEGRYEGQPRERRYRLQVHGLFRPARVMVEGRPVPERRRGDVAGGWVWHQTEQVTEINLTTPVSIGNPVSVTLEQAGEFVDAVAAQAVRAYRERVRRVRLIEQFRWAMLAELANTVDKEPHVLQVTEGVEQTLNDLVDQSAALAGRPPDFRALTAAILSAFLNQPFDSTRKLPTKDPINVEGERKISQGIFSPDELHRMTRELLACELVASVTGDATAWGDPNRPALAEIAGPVVQASFNYDMGSIGAPKLDYDILFPDDGPPGWAEISREVQPDGSATFILRAPLPAVPGSHTLKLRVTATWGPNQTVVEREVVWFLGPDPNDPSEVRPHVATQT